VLPGETRRGIICFKFYITRRFSSRFFVVCASDMVKISFSGAIK
jgi:hypothetical protein